MKIIFNSKKIARLPMKLLFVIILIISMIVPIQILNRPVFADRASEILRQIESINQDISSYLEESSRLSKESNTLQSAIAILVNDKALIQAQINISQAKYDQLVLQINETEKKIQNNKDTLGRTIADMYVDGKITPLEMLASSKNIGDYLDKQEYQTSISNQLSSTIDEIKKLKETLVSQKSEVEKVLGDQKNARQMLVEKENEQQKLLNETQGKEAAYQQLISDGESRKQSLAEEYKNLARTVGEGISDPTKGNYPWGGNGCYVDYDMMSYGGVNGDGTDLLQYACRQCTSYAAWKILEKTGRGYTYWGNAKNWPSSARNNGISTGYSARANSVGVMTSGPYGHVVWVETNPDSEGKITISQYNSYYDNTGDNSGPGWGNYSKKIVNASDYNEFIYF